MPSRGRRRAAEPAGRSGRKLYCAGGNRDDGNGGYILHTASWSRGQQVSALRWWFYRLVLGR